MREQIRSNLENTAGVRKLVDLVKHDDRFFAIFEKKLRIPHPFFCYWKIAVNIQRFARIPKALGESRFSRSADSRQPRYRSFPPRCMDSLFPEGSFNHKPYYTSGRTICKVRLRFGFLIESSGLQIELFEFLRRCAKRTELENSRARWRERERLKRLGDQLVEGDSRRGASADMRNLSSVF